MHEGIEICETSRTSNDSTAESMSWEVKAKSRGVKRSLEMEVVVLCKRQKSGDERTTRVVIN